MGTDKLIWLASYPRSGSNWLRMILNRMLGSPYDHEVTIPSFKGQRPRGAIPRYVYQDDRLVFLKTHNAPDAERMGRIEVECAGQITIYRHPLDVLLSSLNYGRIRRQAELFKRGTIKTVEEIVADGEMDHYFDEFFEADGLESYSGMCGGISDYQARWDRFGATRPHLRICYEDMVANPARHVAAMHDFFALDHDEAKVNEVMEAVQIRTATTGGFFWKKQAFNFEKMLPPATVERFAQVYRSTLEYLGYEGPEGRASGTGAITIGSGRSTLAGRLEVGKFVQSEIRAKLGREPAVPDTDDPVQVLLKAHSDQTFAKDYDKALQTILELVGTYGFEIEGIPEARVRLQLGSAYLRAQQFELGEEQLRISTDLDPDNAYAHFKHGSALSRLRRHGEAVAAFKRVVHLAPPVELVRQARARLAVERAKRDRSKPQPAKAPDKAESGD